MEKDHTAYPAHAPPVRLAFRVSYLGSRFYGSQMQTDSRTVEGEFVTACQRLSLFDDWRKAGFLSAGRTDRGVHARCQVIAFSTHAPARARTVINTQLPPDLWCSAYADVAPEFHPRYDAMSRTYRYYFPKRPEASEAMDRAAQQFLGSHNFSNFARVKDKNPYRNILAVRVCEEDGFVFLEVKAESFLWHQVRCMASALLLVGEGESDEGSIARLLEADADRPLQPAPAEGLILWDTDCGIAWNPVSVEGQSGAFMDHLVRHHALMEKVCRVLKTSQV
ncbi:MAG: tRNA pseudouridine(38-40) synthase TruA [Methanoregula sp.]|nr:tRNA pseudouridine(38-40) synthase TruA [Methanoregula sp.]